ncbi:DUF538 domain-containing protein [Salix suchowensis]|nr:DUF538 domain-containing protein [Salix suchowensis]
MAIINTETIIVLFCTLSLEFIFSPRLSLASSIHDLLISKGLPAGLLPKEVKSYTLSEDGYLENRVLFESVVRANLTYLSLSGVVGLSQEELFLWLPVRDITVDDPGSGLILFDIGVAHKQLSLSLFEYPPNCKPRVMKWFTGS